MPLNVWQQLYDNLPQGVQKDQVTFAASLGHKQILQPIRTLPDGLRGVASLIVNQASFEVQDALAEKVAEGLRAHAPEVIIAVPTLGLGLAENVARRLGHSRVVPLGYSRKFWYEEALSVPISSITTPGGEKKLYIDPRMLGLLDGKRVAVVDDVLSSGRSIKAVLDLLGKVDCTPIAIGAAMLQGEGWRSVVSCPVIGAITTPILRQGPSGWEPVV